MASFNGTLMINQVELNLKMMLEGGQSFRWRKTNTDNEWIGVMNKMLWTLRQDKDIVYFTANTNDSETCKHYKDSLPRQNSLDDNYFSNTLKKYLRLDSPLHSYYEDWSKKDEHFKAAGVQCHGVRILDQDPVENVFSFICSSNNNITRISSMVEKMCNLYGDKIYEENGQEYFGFPNIDTLADDSVQDALRKAGFGYRAKYIQQSAKQLVELGGLDWLKELKSKPYQEAKSELMTLQGIGPKVADCICLMSLGHMEAVPVDTHVFQIATNFYLPHLKSTKTVTSRVYSEIGDFFRQLYGPLAGWAHTILFCADLKKFQDIPTKAIKNKPIQKSIKKIKIETDEEVDLIKNKRSRTEEYKKELITDLRKRKTLKCDDNIFSTTESLETGILKVIEKNFSGRIECSREELNLRVTFNCGQTYRWKQIGENVWRGVMGDKVWTLTQDDKGIDYQVRWLEKFSSPTSTEATNSLEQEFSDFLRDYFRLAYPLKRFYKEWSSRDEHFKNVATSFYGLRMTKQDIIENLFAFVCSSYNTIKRITFMVEWLCTHFGSKISEVDGETYFSFPSVENLAVDGVEDKLKGANFGYRAKYVHLAARKILSQGGSDWFSSLKKMNYSQAKKELMELPGIGAKVADCICLTSLDHLETIPVDTHVFQIAKKYYLPHLSEKKTVSPKAYEEIGQHFRQLFVHYAGWAHTILFCSELRINSSLKITNS